MTRHAISPLAAIKSALKYRQLIWQMTRRDIAGRYRGSMLGLTWSLVTPLLLLTMYTFVFTVVFKARWNTPSALTPDTSLFAVMVFSGLIIHSFFAECISRAPGVIVSQVNFVKKVVFPLEIFPFIITGAALFHFAINCSIMLCAAAFVLGYLPLTAFLLPLVLAPLLLMALGAGWLLASLGVFIRDIGQVISLALTLMMFLSPVFYPIDSLPPAFQLAMYLNPITLIIEQMRVVLIYGHLPDFTALAIYSAIASALAAIGFAWFQRTRHAFADVL